MKAYQIFLFLFLFGLISASIDEMGIMGGGHGFAKFNENIGITEIHELREIQSESSFLTVTTKVLLGGAKIIGNALVNMVYIIPLFSKYGVPDAVTYPFQIILSFLIFLGLFYIITGRSLKYSE